MIIGLTGGIGSGKSAAGALFKDIGVDLIDEKLGFFLLLKSDGNTLYSTKA